MRILSLVLLVAAGSLSSCSVPPDKCFGIAVLNCNLMHGFGGDGVFRELQIPSVKMVGNDVNKTEPMKRKEIIDNKIATLEENYAKVKDLEQEEDSRKMIQASMALYEYVLPVYRNEYQQLAKLFDDGGTNESIQTTAQAISDKYHSRFVELYNNLAEAAKPFAQKHNINVNWDVRTSPQ